MVCGDGRLPRPRKFRSTWQQLEHALKAHQDVLHPLGCTNRVKSDDAGASGLEFVSQSESTQLKGGVGEMDRNESILTTVNTP